MRVGRIRRWTAVAALVGAGTGAIAFAQSPENDLGDRRALQDSCRSYVASPQEAASERCTEALRLASWVVSTTVPSGDESPTLGDTTGRSHCGRHDVRNVPGLGIVIDTGSHVGELPVVRVARTKRAWPGVLGCGPPRSVVGTQDHASEPVRRALSRHHGGAAPRSFRTSFAPGETSMCGLFRVARRNRLTLVSAFASR
jgi:hypothetical protein